MTTSAEQLLDALRAFAVGASTAAGLEVDPAGAATDLIALGKAMAVLDGAVAAAMVRYDRLGNGSPAAVLVQHAGITRTAADNLRKLGRKLEADLPATRARLTGGEIGTAQARTIAGLDDELAAAHEPAPQTVRRQVEAALAEFAPGATTTEVTRAARDARYRLTPETVEREMSDQRDARGITLSPTWAGLTHISGLADPVTAATLTTYLDHHAGRLGHEDTRTSAARRLDALTDAVTLAERITTQSTAPADAPTDIPANGAANGPDNGLADVPALHESCKPSPAVPAASAAPLAGGMPAAPSAPSAAAASAGGWALRGSRRVGSAVRGRPGHAVTGEDPVADRVDPLVGGFGGGAGDGAAAGAARKRLAWRKTSPAHMLIIATHELLTGARGAASARLGDGTVVPAETARRYACEAALTRVILATESEPLELGGSTRLFSTGQVRALIARDQGCRWPGCDAPPVACTPHHVRYWSHGGATDVTNGALLCAVHHRMVHEDRWRLTWAGDAPGTLTIEAPAHWTLRPPPLTSPPPHTHQPRLPKAA